MLTFQDLRSACSSGGSSVLTSVTELAPAAGEHASVAPAKFVDGNKSVFAFETRYVDGESVEVALLDSSQSQGNRGEDAAKQDIHAGVAPISELPRIAVTYQDENLVLTDLDLPHRFADGHIRAGSIDGVPVTQTEQYRAMRNGTPADFSALLRTAPISLLLGAWDSTRKSNQVRVRRALQGEIIGVLADQNATGEDQLSRRGGARVDPVAMSVQLSGKDLEALLVAQEDELSEKNVKKIRENIKKAKGSTVSASGLGLGGIPPQLESLGGVACRRIIRSWVLSFAALRQLRFGGTAEQDVAGRVLLAALGLAIMARSERELYLRANCDLVEKSAPVVTLDLRYGQHKNIDPVTVELADALLAEAIVAARESGVADWQGQQLEITGNPSILHGAVEQDESTDA